MHTNLSCYVDSTSQIVQVDHSIVDKKRVFSNLLFWKGGEYESW